MPVVLKVLCVACGAPIYRERGGVNENLKLEHNFYCSRACGYAHKTRRKILQCDNPDCRKEFPRALNDILAHNYCSQSCAAHINNKKFPKRGPGFKVCGYASCNKKFVGETKYCSRPCYASSRKKHSLEKLIEEVRKISKQFGRIPAKREIRLISEACIKAFGSWNSAIIAAGLTPNRSDSQRMYHQTQTTAKDGHKCDSVSEAIIDNWLTDRHIVHARDAVYPATHHKADLEVNGQFIEYFGLAGDSPRYDRAVKKKRGLCKQHDIPLIELYPVDLYPSLILDQKLKDIAGGYENIGKGKFL